MSYFGGSVISLTASTPVTSTPGTGLIYFNGTSFQYSVNGSAPVTLVSPWTQTGTVVSLTTNADQVGIGTSSPQATTAFQVDASAGSYTSAAVFLNGTVSAPGSGTNSERFGASASATGNSATAVGNGATGSGTFSVALGASASTAGFTGSIALGYGATNDAARQLVIGSSALNGQVTLVVIGNGSTNASPQGVTIRGTTASSGAGPGGSVTLQSGNGNTGTSGGSTTIAGGAGGATGNGGNVLLNGGLPGSVSGFGGEVVLQTADGAGMPLVERLRITDDGAQDSTGIATSNQPAVSPTNHGRLYYDSTLQQYMVSLNGAAYTTLATAVGTTLQTAYSSGQSIIEAAVSGSVTQTPVSITNTVGTTSDVLQVTKDSAFGGNGLTVSVGPTTAATGAGVSITMGATTTGNGVAVTMTAGATGLAGLFSGGSVSCPASSGERFGAGASITGNSVTGVALGTGASLAPGDFNSGVVVGPSCSVTAADVVLIGSGNTVASSGCVVIGRTAAVTGNNQFVLGPAVSDVYLGNTSSSSPQLLTLHGVAASVSNTTGGGLTIVAGSGNGTGNGGAATLSGGAPGSTGVGGVLSMSGGVGGSTSGSGGAAVLTGGSGTAGNASGGTVTVQGGAGQGTASGANAFVNGGLAGLAAGAGGEIVLQTAPATMGTTLIERFRATQDGALNATGIATVSEPAAPAPTDGRIYFDSTRGNFRTSALAGGTGSGYQDLFRWVKVTKSYADFSTGAPSNSITGYTLPAGAVIHVVKIVPTISFTGGTLTDYEVEVGISINHDKYATAYSVFGAVSGANFQLSNTVGSEDQTSSAAILFTANATGGNLSQATQGSVDIYILVSDAGF